MYTDYDYRMKEVEAVKDAISTIIEEVEAVAGVIPKILKEPELYTDFDIKEIEFLKSLIKAIPERD